MKWGKIFFTIYLTGLLIYFTIDIKAHPDWSINWSIYALAIAVLALSGFFAHFESKMPTAKETALLATLSALAALGRVPFAAIPNVQPTTFLVLLSGYVFGPGAGFAVGVLAALTSDFFLGLGPWTPWQMLAWGLAGWTAGIIRYLAKTPPRLLLVVFSVLWGYFYGLIMNTWHWLTFIYPLTWQTFTATCVASVWFDTFHAAGNGLFMWFMGRDLISTLDRFKQRLSVKFIGAEK
ncbi:ECF transporter S component [Desulfotruncus alcoholivorax]|uniref:ECF transporter S component n=1 Tax=Desulfotruncus alcoholivorax TaxID=265477 RepID=UPI0003F6B35D|nr:ECF transporter S component [Desulfotruncus alcoholivorax]